MKCIKCGSEISDTSKFCGYCGTPVTQSQKESLNGEKVLDNNQVNNISSEQVKMEQANEINVSKQVNLNTKQTDKKNSNIFIYVICGVLLAFIASILLLKAFYKTSQTEPIEALKKAASNIKEQAQNSGTITTSLLLESNNSDTMNLSGTVKYQKNDNEYNVALALNKSIFFDDVNLYGNIKSDKITLYAMSSLVDMFLGSSTENATWIYYELNLSDLSALELNSTTKLEDELDLSKIKIDKKLKYVGKENGSNHYTLTVDDELINDIKSSLPKEEQQVVEDSIGNIGENIALTKAYIIDFYINDSNELEKISIDLAKYIDDKSISKAIVSIEFKDLNNTSVIIPNEALSSTTNLEAYLSQNISDNEFTPTLDIG